MARENLRWRRLACCGLCSLLLCLCLLRLPSARAGQLPAAAPVPAGLVAAPLLAKGISWTHVQTWLGNRRRMIQFATIGMCIGLYILMRK